MAALYLAARAADHRSTPLNTLAVAAAVLVAIDPLTVPDPAFVLTFGATFAILIAVPVLSETHEKHETHENHEKHENRNRTKPSLAKMPFVAFVFSWVSWLVQALRRATLPMFTASLATEALLFPVGALVFSRITFAGLGLNFLALPLMAVAQVAGMAVVPLAFVSARVASLAGWCAYVGAAGLVWSAGLVQFVPAVAYRIAAPSVLSVTIYYAAIVGAWRLGRRASGTACAVIAAAAAMWILTDPLALLAARGDGRLHVTFIDVGQGDAAFVRFPFGSTLLVDSGGLSFSSGFDIGDRVVAPVLRDAGCYRLDFLALTHGDPDHIGGAPSVVRDFRPREVWEGIPVPRFVPLTLLRVATQQTGARWANVYAGDRRFVDEVEIVARHPRPADWERQKVRNDDSVVLELRWRDVSVLLTGDIGKAVEGEIAGALPSAPLRVVKAPHHGSRTSSSEAFVGAIRPQVLVISVGRGNHFGHPATEVVERYRAMGAEIFRTDRDGAVRVDTDGRSLSVTTFMGRRLDLHETHENTKSTK